MRQTQFHARESVVFDHELVVRDSNGVAIDITGWTFALDLQRRAGIVDVSLGLSAIPGDEGFEVVDGPAGVLRMVVDQETLAGIEDTTGEFTLFGDLIGSSGGTDRFLADIRLTVTTPGTDYGGQTFTVVLDAVGASFVADASAAADRSEVARDLATSASAAALGAADNASDSAAEAEVHRGIVEGIAASAGSLRRFETKALMDAALASIDADEFVEVQKDETKLGRVTRYQKQGSALVFVRILAGDSIVIYADPSGNDANVGTDPSAPKATLLAATSVMRGGDTLRTLSGTFRETLKAPAGSIVESWGPEKTIISGQDVISEFTPYSGAAYSFEIELEQGFANRDYPGVFQNGSRLQEVVVGIAGIADDTAAKAFVVANPGTFYFAGPGSRSAGWDAGLKTYYIHTTDSSDPATKLIEAYKRRWCIDVNHRDITLLNVRLQSGCHHDGSSPKRAKGCTSERHACHGSLPLNPNMESCVSLQPNPKYAGAAFHSNPSFMTSNGVWKDCIAASDGTGIAFFTHGADTGNIRQLQSIISCEANGFSTAISMGAVKSVEITDFRAQDAQQFFSGNSDDGAQIVTVRGLTFSGGLPEGGTRFLAGRTLNDRLELFDFNIDFTSQEMFYSAGILGRIEMERFDIVLHTHRTAGNTPTFFAAVNAPVDAKVHSGRFAALGDATGIEALFSGSAVTDLSVQDVLFVNHKDKNGYPRFGTCRIANIDVDLKSIDPDARAFFIQGEKVIASYDGPNSIRYKRGTYEPGDAVFSGIAFSGGSNQPRAYIAVGDEIVRIQNDIGSELIATPPSHLRAVCFFRNASGHFFAAAGDDGLVMVSNNNFGAAFATTDSGTEANLRGIAAEPDAGVVIAVGFGGVVIRSTDAGTTWAAVESNTTADLMSIATDGNVWIACGKGGKYIYSSDDGLTWTEATAGASDHHAVFYSGQLSLFFMGSDLGALRTAPAAAPPVWTTRTSNTFNRIVAFAEGEGQVIAACRQTSKYTDTFLVTSDGTTWAVDPHTLPFEVRALVGPRHPHYASPIFNQLAFAAVGEAATIGLRNRAHWSAMRFRRNAPLPGSRNTKFLLGLVR